MKTLIYGMQSSGASLFAYWLSQQNQCLSIIDLYHDQLAPSLDHDNVVLKCVVTKKYSLQDHIDSFVPDRVVIFVRNPVENYLSLSQKIYANYGGEIEEKLDILNVCLSKKMCNFIVKYEDFIMTKVPSGLGDVSCFNFEKTLDEIKKYNFTHNVWCETNYRKKWGIGNINASKNSLFIFKKIKNLSNVFKIYEEKV